MIEISSIFRPCLFDFLSFPLNCAGRGDDAWNVREAPGTWRCSSELQIAPLRTWTLAGSRRNDKGSNRLVGIMIRQSGIARIYLPLHGREDSTEPTWGQYFANASLFVPQEVNNSADTSKSQPVVRYWSMRP